MKMFHYLVRIGPVYGLIVQQFESPKLMPNIEKINME